MSWKYNLSKGPCLELKEMAKIISTIRRNKSVRQASISENELSSRMIPEAKLREHDMVKLVKFYKHVFVDINFVT